MPNLSGEMFSMLKNNIKIHLRKSKIRNKIKFFYYFFFFYLNPFKKTDLIHSFCNFCNKKSFFLYYHYLKGSKYTVSDSYNQTGLCFGCGSNHRNRIILKYFQNIYSGSDKSIYLPSGDGSLFNFLKKFKNSFFSDFYDDPKSHSILVPHEDLTSLSFENNTFDIVISEHVMEHVNDPKKAFNEVFRVLKNKGTYLFSIPFESKDKSLVRVDKDYNVLMKKKYHLDPLRNQGILVFNDFSKKDFFKKYVPNQFKSKEIFEDVIIVNCVKVISEVIILQK